MKIAVLGAAGVRTPLILEAMMRRQERLGLEELALMDIDSQRLELIAAVGGQMARQRERDGGFKIRLSPTTQAAPALEGADFVITTFRVGGAESRVVDERVPLEVGILGQETTGPGGFAMGMRTIPVLLDYAKQMQKLCPQAWLINFANPAGMLAEALHREAGWERSVGICDAPSEMHRMAAALLGAQPGEVFLDYFGLNHLAWVRRVIYKGQDMLPRFLEMIHTSGGLPGLPFEPRLLDALGMIPNEYNYYYYYRTQAVKNILAARQTRGEEIVRLDQQLYSELEDLHRRGMAGEMLARYLAYLHRRSETYMAKETGREHGLSGQDAHITQAVGAEGYAGVALDLIEGLSSHAPTTMVLNTPNLGAVSGMEAGDVVEVPSVVSAAGVQPLSVGEVPGHALALMKQVKSYELLTIEAAVEKSYPKALLALSLHPLVMDQHIAEAILDGYIQRHGSHFPELLK